jgi:hypothetical protein
MKDSKRKIADQEKNDKEDDPDEVLNMLNSL